MSLSEGSSLDRNKWLLIAGPAIIKRLARDVFLMLKDSPDYIGLGFDNEADDLHLSMTVWTLKRINFPYFSDTKGSGKSKLDKYRPEIEAFLANGSSQKFIARRYGTTEANLHHWMKKHGLKKTKISR